MWWMFEYHKYTQYTLNALNGRLYIHPQDTYHNDAQHNYT
jgi:hypothetical protein